MNISLEEIILLIVKEVIAELTKKGIKIDDEIKNLDIIENSHRKIKMDFSEYKTPLITEAHVLDLSKEIVEIEVPLNTIITPSAKDLINKRKITITKK